MGPQSGAERPVREWRAAGGVPVRWAEGRLEVLVLHHRREGLWRLPKGRVEAGETLQETAARETQEEAGLVVEVGPEIARSSYEFTGRKSGEREHKTVHHFLLRAAGAGDLNPQEPFDGARWATPVEAMELLHFENEREAVRAAVEAARRET